jgi:hypothetical protein
MEQLLLSAICTCRVSDVRQMKIHAPQSRCFDAEIATAKLKKYESAGSDQILAELIQTGCKTLHSEITKLAHFIFKGVGCILLRYNNR